jgi:hypothetical protein
MNALLENPIGIGIFGLVIVGLLVFMAIQLGECKAIYASAGVLAVTIALVVASIAIETDKEKIIRSVEEVASALRANDHQRALSFLHPNAVPAIQRAKQDLASVQFKEAKVTSIQSVTVNEGSNPPTAIIEFIGVIKASSDRYTGGVVGTDARLFKLYWMQNNDRWLIHDYEHSSIKNAFTNKTQ